MTGDFAQDTSLNMSAAQPPASSRPSTTATGSPSNGSSVRLTSSAITASILVDVSDLRVPRIPDDSGQFHPSLFFRPRNHGATS